MHLFVHEPKPVPPEAFRLSVYVLSRYFAYIYAHTYTLTYTEIHI